MDTIFGSIYSWFLSLFGDDLGYYLWGYNPVTATYSNPNIYNIVGIITLAVSFVLVIVFYYIFNHPRFCKWWSWLITLGVNAIIGLFIGYGIVYSKYINGFIPLQLMYQYDEQGNIIANLIGEGNCWGFGIANLIVSILFFVVFTFLCKWGSSNAKHVPFL